MMHVKELPYNEERFKTYNYSGTIGVVAANYKDLENWYLNNCIQWQAEKDNYEKGINITAFDFDKNLPFIENMYMNGYIVKDCLDDIIHSLAPQRILCK